MNEDDLCHAADSASGETSSAQAPLQTGTAREAEGDGRSCTCHPDDRPPVCQREFATTHCRLAYAEKQLEEAKEIIGKLVSEDIVAVYPHGPLSRRARSFLKENGNAS